MVSVLKQLTIFIFLLFIPINGLANDRDIMTPEDICDIRRAVWPSISHDGRQIVFDVIDPDVENIEIWMVPSDNSRKPLKFVSGAADNYKGQWSPDGKYLAFYSSRGKRGGDQIYLLHANGGKVTALTKDFASIHDFKWSPDSGHIAFTARDERSKVQKERRKSGNYARVLDERFRFIRLYTLDIKTRKVTLITKGEEDVYDFDYSPDGSKLALNLSSTPTFWMLPSKLVTINTDGSDESLISDQCIDNVRWSPDSRSILFMTATEKGIGSLPAIVSGNGGKPKILATSYPGTIWRMEWGKSASSIYVSSQEGVEGIIGVLDTQKGTVKRLRQLGQPYHYGMTWQLSEDKSRIAFLDAGPKSPSDLYSMAIDGSDVKRHTHLNPQLESFDFGDVTTVQWKSDDRMTIEGVLIKPVGFEKGRTYPLVVQVHGGPESAWWHGWLNSSNEWGQYLAGNGYMVLLPNPRGSEGYGLSFMEKNIQDWGGGDFKDILSGVDYLIEEGLADPKRLAIGGWSYGGYMSAWAITQTRRFKAAVIFGGVSNLYSFYGATNIHESILSHFLQSPYENSQPYIDQSPLTHIKNVKTPALILHGEGDKRVPVTQAYELYRGLQDVNVPSRCVVYPKEGHCLKKRAHRIDLLKRILNWYDTYLKKE